jgi:hypothetical protein
VAVGIEEALLAEGIEEASGTVAAGATAVGVIVVRAQQPLARRFSPGRPSLPLPHTGTATMMRLMPMIISRPIMPPRMSTLRPRLTTHTRLTGAVIAAGDGAASSGPTVGM